MFDGVCTYLPPYERDILSYRKFMNYDVKGVLRDVWVCCLKIFPPLGESRTAIKMERLGALLEC